MGLTSVFGGHACAIDVHCIHLILYIVRLDNLLAHFLHTFRFQNLNACMGLINFYIWRPCMCNRRALHTPYTLYCKVR